MIKSRIHILRIRCLFTFTLLSFCHEQVPRLSIILHVRRASWPGFTSVYFGCSANRWKHTVSEKKKIFYDYLIEKENAKKKKLMDSEQRIFRWNVFENIFYRNTLVQSRWKLWWTLFFSQWYVSNAFKFSFNI